LSAKALIGTRKGLFTLSKANNWQVEKVDFLAGPVTSVLKDTRDGSIYVALNHGHFGVKTHRSDDDGATWKEIATPLYPEQPENLPPHPGGMPSYPWKLVQIWALEAGDPDQPGLIWCGTLPGGLFVSRDRGESWEMVRSLWDMEERQQWFGGGADVPGIHSICVDPRNSNHVTIGVSCGGVWTTFDAGETWESRAKGMWASYMPPELKFNENIQDPHLLVQAPSNPDAMWVQHHNGVFKTINGGISWDEVINAKPSNFGFAVAVHPTDPNTAWFVPATKDEVRVPVEGKVVASRTRDGGETFEVLQNGLPQNNAYDIVFRHCLDVDSSGNSLIFGSTTGNLWMSDDQGDNWTTISSNLPPVYCVRFID
jgi:hypothetical protein